MTKTYTVYNPKRVDRSKLTGTGQRIALTNAIEEILRNQMYRLEHYNKIGKAGLRNFKGDDVQRKKCQAKVERDGEVIKELRELFPD